MFVFPGVPGVTAGGNDIAVSGTLVDGNGMHVLGMGSIVYIGSNEDAHMVVWFESCGEVKGGGGCDDDSDSDEDNDEDSGPYVEL